MARRPHGLFYRHSAILFYVLLPIGRRLARHSHQGLKMKSSLTIAGSDPTGGAGAQSDIATFRAFGVGALSAITAVTAQNGEKGFAVEPVSPRLLTRPGTALLAAF